VGSDETIMERLMLLRNEVNYLKKERDAVQSFQVYIGKGNLRLRRAVERSLQVATEACLDIGRRLIAEKGLRFPEDNKDVFAVLAEERVIPYEMLTTLQRMVGFRNVLVHEYVKLDHAAVYGVFKKRLGDFDAYAEAIVSYLEDLQAEARDEG
jgi:uncharacterized protein YutE (UPF0331/DUF86 family)